MAHRKWKETKQLPCMLPGPAVPGCCFVSFHILWAILSTSTVEGSAKVRVDGKALNNSYRCRMIKTFRPLSNSGIVGNKKKQMFGDLRKRRRRRSDLHPVRDSQRGERPFSPNLHIRLIRATTIATYDN